jgi:hypothetical protein
MAIIACPNCGKSISSESINCIHCSSPIAHTHNVENQQNQGSPAPNQNANQSNESFSQDFTKFYKGDFKEIFSTFFTNPIDGIRGIFANTNANSQKTSLILYVSAFIFYFILSYLFDSNIREYAPFSVFIKIAFLPVIIMFIISTLSFIIKSIFGKADFKNELLTGGICAIPLGLFIAALFILKIFAGDKIMSSLTSFSASNFQDLGLVFVLILLYILLMLINVFQQSLKASGTKDGASWYLSPISILLALYVSIKIYYEVILK